MKLISIGQMAQTYHISTRTLRLYHEKGLLTPEYVDPLTGYRYYAPAQADRLEVILQMRAMGLSLTQISAATKALQAVSLGLLEDHMSHCVLHAAQAGDEEGTAKIREASDAIARLVRS